MTDSPPYNATTSATYNHSPVSPIGPISGGASSPPSSSISSADTPQSEPGEGSWNAFVQRLHPRPRPLTPPNFGEDKPADDAASTAAPYALFQESASFYKVPPNIRLDILRLAFGDRRLHIDLSYDCPDLHLDDPNLHHGIGGGEEGLRFRDMGELPAWRWWGSVCHRIAPDAPIRAMTKDGLTGPWYDHCREGQAAHCASWRDYHGPSACHVGAMGWLLSCRQSYAEGITVLYSTNTIVITNERLVSHLPQLLLPQRLAAITSLELVWPLRGVRVQYPVTAENADGEDETAHYIDEAHLKVLLRLVSSEFPALRRLHVTLDRLHPDPFPLEFWLAPDYALVIKLYLDSFVKRMPLLKECAFALPSFIFMVVYAHAAFDGPPYNTYRTYTQVWRSVQDDEAVVWIPYVDSYPDAPYQLAQASRAVPGYWILGASC